MKKKQQKKDNQIVIYQAKSGGIELRGDYQKDTIWATQAQIAHIFNSDRSVTTKHINNILKDKELDRNSVCAKIAHTASDGKKYQVQYYNLDVILAVGYRTNSKNAIEFRQWATKILREHITRGFTINKSVIKNNYTEFQKAVENIKHLLPADAKVDNAGVLELVSAFADTWLSLEAYDKDTMLTKGVMPSSGFCIVPEC